MSEDPTVYQSPFGGPNGHHPGCCAPGSEDTWPSYARRAAALLHQTLNGLVALDAEDPGNAAVAALREEARRLNTLVGLCLAQGGDPQSPSPKVWFSAIGTPQEDVDGS